MTAADLTIKDLHVEVKRCPECGVGFGLEAAFCPFDGIALTTSTWDPTRDPLIDSVIDGRYEVVEPLGEGGMGTVYKVRHMTLDRMFAMKVLRKDLAADPGLAARFLQEARATAAIHHPSVVAINDFGSLDAGAPYFVMELLVGETLATRMRARGLLAPTEAASIARKLADALSAAHAANVVHRDLKPENVFLVGVASGKEASDVIRIVDFGAAKIVGGSKLTRPGVVFGTPYYMSPEQASGQPVDARADVYSLGVLLYEMITGSVPFEADTYMGVLTKHMFAAPTKPSERTPSGVQLGELEGVILRALEKEPSERYPSMIELGAALDKAIAARPSSSVPRDPVRTNRPIGYTEMSTADRIQRSVSRQVDEEQRRKRRTIAIAVISAVATLGMCALAVAIFQEPGGSKESAPAVLGSSTVLVPTLALSAPASASAANPSAPTVIAITSPVASVMPADTVGKPPPPAVVPGPAAPTRPSVAAPKGREDPLTGRPTPKAPTAPKSPDDLPDPWKR